MTTSGTNQGNVYSSRNLSEYMCSSLPKDAYPHLRNPYDAVALLSHACMLAVGFRLVGLGEDHRIGNFPLKLSLKPSKLTKPPEATSQASSPQLLPSEWNSTTTSHYAFRYSHSQSSLQYIIKISRLGPKAIVNGMGIGDDKVHALNVTTSEFLSASSFPFTISSRSSSSPEEENTTNTARRIQDLFISPGRLTDLGNLFKIQIVQKLAPGLQKEGYEDSAHAASQSNTQAPQPQRPHPPPTREEPDPNLIPAPARPYPFNDPLAAAPRRQPFPAGDFPPPGFDDEYDLHRPPRGIGAAERRPLNIGERDLYPPGLGPHDPLRIGGVGGMGGIGGGGMHPTFDDPMFGGGGAGGGGYDPRAPPGARYDPVGPGDGPPNLRGGPRFPGGGGGGPPNPFGGFGGGDFI